MCHNIAMDKNMIFVSRHGTASAFLSENAFLLKFGAIDFIFLIDKNLLFNAFNIENIGNANKINTSVVIKTTDGIINRLHGEFYSV